MRIDDHRYPPALVAVHDYRRRNNARLFEASVTSVHAVLETPEQRCWIESKQVIQQRRRANEGRNNGERQTHTHDAQRCESVISQDRPDYLDVANTFRGQAHRIQKTVPPGGHRDRQRAG